MDMNFEIVNKKVIFVANIHLKNESNFTAI